MEEINDKITFVDENGNQKELKIFMTYHSEKFNKDYIFFQQDEDNDLLIAGYVTPDGEVHDIESDEEYEELDQVLEEYQDELDKKESN